jgi:bifunctional DNA primase/polymerase-like protein
VKDATIDPGVIERWWQRADFNIGVATGAVSGILVIDVDDVDAEAELRRLETAHVALPATVEAITARGRHLFFRWPEQDIRNSAGKIAPGIDVRGNGGYIIAPPSLHPSGRRYAWSVDSANVFAPAPAWLLDRYHQRAKVYCRACYGLERSRSRRRRQGLPQ